MSVDIEIDLYDNRIDGDEVTAHPGDIVTLSAVEQGPPREAADGFWEKDDKRLDQPQVGVIKVVVDSSWKGEYIFTEAESGDTHTVTIALHEQARRRRFKIKITAGTLAVIGVILLYALLGFIIISGFDLEPRQDVEDGEAQWRSIAFGVLTLVTVLLLVHLAGRAATSKSGLKDLVTGADRRASTSKIQYLLWTLLLGFILAHTAGYVSIVKGAAFECGRAATETSIAVGPQEFCIPTEPNAWTPYLILLGVPAATAAIAKGVVSYKIANGTLQKSVAEQATLANVATNDNGNADLVDVQYLLFNLIAFVYVLVAFINQHKLPAVPDLLLGLTSAAAGTYALNKSLLNNKPLITSVVPSTIRPRDTLTITGENLLLAGPDGRIPDVLNAKVGGLRAVAHRDNSRDNTLTVDVPRGISSGPSCTVTIVTAADVEAEGFPVVVLPITVIGWSGNIPNSQGGNARLRVTGLPKPHVLELAERRAVKVTIGGQSVDGGITSEDEVTLNLPPLVAKEHEVTVAFEERTSAVAKLPIAP